MGNFCPQASPFPIECKGGKFLNYTKATSSSECIECSPRYFCQGAGLPEPTGLLVFYLILYIGYVVFVNRKLYLLQQKIYVSTIRYYNFIIVFWLLKILLSKIFCFYTVFFNFVKNWIKFSFYNKKIKKEYKQL